MCGIAGLITDDRVRYETISQMINSINHRGPDEIGFFIEANVGLGHARLSIIDLENGKQPAANEDRTVIVVFNGEIFNYMDLKKDLIDKAHIIENNSDTAILPHMYEQYGLNMFDRLNGQFAIAIWDKNNNRLILARDRMGEKPLYYFYKHNTICFASEVKAILKSGLVKPAISPLSIKQVFTYWSTLSDRSTFKDIYSIPPGSFLIFQDGEMNIDTYWRFTYQNICKENIKEIDYYVNELDCLLNKSIERRMLADVPVSFYLSGGLDSSIITSMAAGFSGKKLNTFSITFDDEYFDESKYQRLMSNYLGTNHNEVKFSMKELPDIIKDVIYHVETPVLRTGVFPMYVLAKLVRGDGKKVVISGEGSDELFGGYDIFREAKIREFCNRNPDSKIRALLYKRINTFVKGLDSQHINSLAMFYSSPNQYSCLDSHIPRWRLGKYSQQFFSQEFRSIFKQYEEQECIESILPEQFNKFTSVQRAQYLEIMTFLPNYLLSSQGDRVSMASGVECRCPFLDNGILDFAASIPDTLKIKALNEKYLIKKLALKYLPKEIFMRKKFPYRAPISIPELMRNDYIRYITSPKKLEEYGVFDPVSSANYLLTLRDKHNIKERDVMLFLGILTTQILVDEFIV